SLGRRQQGVRAIEKSDLAGCQLAFGQPLAEGVEEVDQLRRGLLIEPQLDHGRRPAAVEICREVPLDRTQEALGVRLARRVDVDPIHHSPSVDSGQAVPLTVERATETSGPGRFVGAATQSGRYPL